MKKHSRRLLITAIVIYGLVSFIHISSNYDVRRTFTDRQGHLLVKLGSISRIYIDGNFSDTSLIYGWCSGNGTDVSPYIIENITVDAEYNTTCIVIKNSVERFIIRNCTIINGNSIGIWLQNTRNGTLINNTIRNMVGNAIYFEESPLNNIMENFIYNNGGDGILMENLLSSNNSISNNFIYNNTGDGIDLWIANNITIWNNSIYDNENGILTYLPHDSNISNNHVFNNRAQGIHLEDMYSGNVTDNTVYGNGQDGIELEDSTGVTMKNNTVYNHQGYCGILLFCSNNNNIVQNNTIYTCENGIELNNAKKNLILENVIFNTTEAGIYMVADNNTFVGNSVCDNQKIGIDILFSDDNSFFGNRVCNNGENGIELASSYYNNFSGNTITQNGRNREYLEGHGIILFGSYFNNFSGNTINDNADYGMYLIGSNSNRITNNIFLDNKEAIREWYSSGNVIENNTIQDRGSQFLGDLQKILTIVAIICIIIVVIIVVTTIIKKKRKRRNQR